MGKYKYLHSQNGRFCKRKIREPGEAFLRRRISSLQDRTRAKRYLFWQHNGCMNKMMTQNHFQTASRIHLFIIETFCKSKVLFSFSFFFTPGIYKNCVINPSVNIGLWSIPWEQGRNFPPFCSTKWGHSSLFNPKGASSQVI